MKMKPIEKLLKVLILFTSIVSMISCEKNEIEDSFNTKMSSENISKNQVLNELNDNKIIEFVSDSKYFTNSNELLKNNQTTFSNSDSPIFQKIVKPNEYITYSLRLNSYTSQKPYFKYFVINKEISGIEKAGFVKYIPSTPTYELDVDNFTGDIEIYNTDNELFAKTTFQNGQPVSNISNKSNNTTFGCYNVSYIIAHPCSHGGGHMPGQSCNNGLINDAYYEIRTTVVCIDTIKSIVPPDTFAGFEGGGGGGGGTILNLLNVPEPFEGEPSFNNESFMFYQQVFNFLQANPAYNNLVNHQYANSCLVSDWIVPTVVDYFRYNSFDEQQNQINVINAMNMFTNFLQFESNQYNFEEMLVNKFQTFQLLLQNSQWFTSQTNQTRQDIFNYLLENHLNEQSRVFAQELIDYCIENNNSQESIDEINNILDLIDDGKINGEEVLFGPDTPITNMADYLSCFNTSQGATITIYADQPVNGSHSLFSISDGVGHAFISIKQGNNIATLGFYPQSSVGSIIPNNLTPDPTDFFPTPGVFGNDQGHTYDVSLTVPINSSGLTNLINGFISIAENNPVYNLGSLNCTDIAIMAFESNTNVNIPSCESPGPWSGQTPGTLGQIIRNMSNPVGGVKNTTGGNAPNNNCN